MSTPRTPGLEAAGDASVRRRDRDRLRRGDGVRPDRSTLREFMREFELRAVMERLEEALPDEDAVPGRSVETELEIEVVEGSPEDLREGGAAMAIEGDSLGRGAGRPDRRRLLSLDELAVALGEAAHRPRPEVSRGRAAMACSPPRHARESSLRLDHDTMIAAFCSSRSGAPTSWSSSPPTRASASPRRLRPPRASPTMASSPWVRSWRPASTPPRRCDGRGPRRRPAPPHRGARPDAAARRRRAAAGHHVLAAMERGRG